MKNGLFAALLVVAYFLAFWFLDKKWFLNAAISWSSMVIYLAFMWKNAVDERALLGGKIEFKPALRAAFIVFLVANVAYWLLFYGLCLVDNQLTDHFKDLRLGQIQQQIEAGTGDPQLSNDLRKEAEDLTKNGFRIGLGDVLLRLSMGTIGGFALAALIGFFVKTEDAN